MNFLSEFFQHRREKDYCATVARYLRGFLLSRDPEALLRSRTMAPAYLMAFGLFLRHVQNTGNQPDVQDRLSRMLDEENLGAKAAAGVDMTALALSCAVDSFPSTVPPPEDWERFDKRIEEALVGRAPSTREAYKNFGRDLMASIAVIRHPDSGDINSAVVLVALMSAVLVARATRTMEGAEAARNSWLRFMEMSIPEDEARDMVNLFFDVSMELEPLILKPRDRKASPP